ncbi:MAG: hypothetical protein CM15mP49_35340 [Actinomycetota bacterium]|nr:MAG: hypothetical protein CM15mP49_35340 [Actinomycetota bacterium]
MVLHAPNKRPKGRLKAEVSHVKAFRSEHAQQGLHNQVHGLGGIQRYPLAHMYQHARWARFAEAR